MSATLFVLGNAMIDESLTVPALPAPGETVVATGLRRGPGGKGLNQAIAAARAGAQVQFCAALGHDAEADEILRWLEHEPRLATKILRKPMPTDRSVILVDTAGENAIVSLCSCADAVTEAEAAAFTAQAGPTDILLLQGNLCFAATAAAMAATAAPVILNPAPLRWPVTDLLGLCTAVIVNRVEAERLTGAASPSEAAGAIARAVQGCAIVTLGESGCMLADTNGVSTFPTLPAQALDTTGAGDAFCGTLAAARLAGLDWPASVLHAQKAALKSVRRMGATEIRTSGRAERACSLTSST